MSDAGVNWNDIAGLAASGINWDDIGRLSVSSVNWMTLAHCPLQDQLGRSSFFID